MTDPYEELRVLHQRLRRIEEAAGVIERPRVWTAAEIADRPTFEANRDAIYAAIREGRVDMSSPPPPERVEFPDAGPGLRQVAPGGIFELTTGEKS
jgi:hypothetical protein